MTGVTLLIATIAALVAFLSSPGRSLAVYCATLALYPQALTLKFGTADFSVSRICILAVLANAVFRAGRHRTFQWMWIDVFILSAWIFSVISLLQTFPALAVERQAGAFFDTVLPYLAARLLVTSQDEYITVVKSLAILAVPIAILALVQMFSGTNPVGFLSEYYVLGMRGDRAEHHDIRFGLYRAAATFPHPISLGLFFGMVGILTASLWHDRVWARSTVVALIAVAGVGMFSSLSSGPLLTVVGAAVVFLVYFDWRLAIALAGLAFASVVSIAAYSGETYAEVLTNFAIDPGTAEFRLKLYREALSGGMSGHWWTGYGYVGWGPGTINDHFHWARRDIVSFYLQILVRTGLLGLLPFLLGNICYYAHLVRALGGASMPEGRWMAWCLLAGMVGWNFAMMTVGPDKAILQLLYLLMAISTNMPIIVAAKARRAS